MPRILFEKSILLSTRQRFQDETIVWTKPGITIDFGYPFIIHGKVCSGFDSPPYILPLEFTSQKGYFTRCQLAKLVRDTYKQLYREKRYESFHGPSDLEISGIEKKGAAKLWRLTIDS